MASLLRTAVRGRLVSSSGPHGARGRNTEDGARPEAGSLVPARSGQLAFCTAELLPPVFGESDSAEHPWSGNASAPQLHDQKAESGPFVSRSQRHGPSSKGLSAGIFRIISSFQNFGVLIKVCSGKKRIFHSVSYQTCFFPWIEMIQARGKDLITN